MLFMHLPPRNRIDSFSQAATITLRKGNPADLDTISVLTCKIRTTLSILAQADSLIADATSGTYTWIPDLSLANASDYALEITQGDEMNYSGEFTLTGKNAAAVSAAEAATSSMASAAAALTLSFSQVGGYCQHSVNHCKLQLFAAQPYSAYDHIHSKHIGCVYHNFWKRLDWDWDSHQQVSQRAP